MTIKPTVDEVKSSAALFQYGTVTGNQKYITDDLINKLINDITLQVEQWLSQNNIPIPETTNELAGYNIKRLIVLEVIINLALSYYVTRSAEDDYIGNLKKERDYYKEELKNNIRNLTGQQVVSKIAQLKDGNVFGGNGFY